MNDSLMSLAQWDQTWQELGATLPNPSVYQQLIERYSEPHRHYHTLQHLQDCLAHLWQWQTLSAGRSLHCNRAEIAIALWFHDAIYDPHRKDNEEKSGQLAYQVAIDQGVKPEIADRIKNLILATQHDVVPQTLETQILVDIDLAILGAPVERFQEYEHQIRQEYAWVPDVEFCKARRQILDRFLGRSSIYITAYFQNVLEVQARANLRRSLSQL
ncbi:MAG: hypothetical protein WCD18_05920 [Thermosynechococcaceae cyanobacterium]